MKKYLILILFFALPFIGKSQSFFSQPVMTFIHRPTETISELSFTNESLTQIQSVIDARRVSNPNDIIRITLNNKLTIGTTPLKLSDKMLLFLNNTTIEASSSATATSLIAVENAHFVSIGSLNSGILDGKSKNIKGINVVNGGKIHVDNLSIRNCSSGGFNFSGTGMDVFADPGSITRCVVSNCSAFGIQFVNSYNFVCSDNTVQTCNSGIIVNANYSSVTNNKVTLCTTGISDASTYDAIAYNTISSCTTAIALTLSCTESLISHNSLKTNTLGMLINSNKARIYYNDCNNTNEISGNGTANHLYANKGITSAEANNAGCIYFNPPLIGNQHTDLVKLGKTRYDLTINGGPLNAVKQAVNDAHQIQPNAVVVVHLNGTFTTTGTSDSLLVEENECYLLNGIINGDGASQTVVY
jgi:hypothetical protein